MHITINENGASCVAVIECAELVVYDEQSTLDLIGNLSFVHKCYRAVLPKACVAEEVFELKNGLLGGILQKFANYRVSVAIVGDFSTYGSKSLHDFIYESNQGRHVFFLPTVAEALEKLHALG